MNSQLIALASKMGVSVNDLRGFLVCLSGHIANGLSLEQAVLKHQDISREVFNTVAKASPAQRRAFVQKTFFPA